jgi:outer membrane protein OmpA-like peptidoglycan-associated protein
MRLPFASVNRAFALRSAGSAALVVLLACGGEPPTPKTADNVTCFTSGPLKGRTLKLVGHADPRGDSDYNMTLGQSRADSVAGYMRSKGMDKAKTESTSRGAMDATGSDDPSWARDRRVDLMLGQ